jgi:hypothetical protein
MRIPLIDTHRTALAIPSAADPPCWGAGRRSARHVKTALTQRSDTGGSGGGLLGLPGSKAGGMADRNHPRTVTRRRSPGHPGVVAPPPEAQ